MNKRILKKKEKELLRPYCYNEPKQMTYGKKTLINLERDGKFPIEILAEGKYLDYEFLIQNCCSHPTCYVRIPKNHKYYKEHYDFIDIECHGGLTFTGIPRSKRDSSSDDEWWIGWDYAHCGDMYWNPKHPFALDGHKYTTEELFNDVKDVILQLSNP